MQILTSPQKNRPLSTLLSIRFIFIPFNETSPAVTNSSLNTLLIVISKQKPAIVCDNALTFFFEASHHIISFAKPAFDTNANHSRWGTAEDGDDCCAPAPLLCDVNTWGQAEPTYRFGNSVVIRHSRASMSPAAPTSGAQWTATCVR